MHPIRPDPRLEGPSSDPLLSAAREAWFDGDWARCLDLIARCAPAAAEAQREALLLHGRALLRLRRFAPALDLLTPVLRTFVNIDEACTARMLHATATAAAHDPERGLALLRDVSTSARTLGAHPAVVAEVEYSVAYVHWLKRDYEAVLEHAVLAEQAGADVISVRAASLRGFVALAKERYHKALKLFRWAYETYRSCRQRDADLAEQIVVQIAALEVALQSAEVRGTHTLPPEIGTRLADAAVLRVPSVTRMQIASLDSWLYAFEGEQDRAYDRARVADRLAPSPAWLTWSLSNRAKIAGAFGDLACARAFATDALEIAGTVSWDATTDEERVGLLSLAEIAAVTQPADAIDLLARYDALVSKMDRSRVFHDDVRLWIVETHVRGLVHRIRGDDERAWQAFKSVHATASRVKIVWRAALALIELDATPSVAQPCGEHYLQAAALLVRQNFPHSFLARRLGRWMNVYSDPIAGRLPAQPREVLRHFLCARSAKDVAAIMGLSQHTVKDYTETLFRAFGVHSKEALLVRCYERGIGSPAWWNALAAANARPALPERSEAPAALAPKAARRRRETA